MGGSIDIVNAVLTGLRLVQIDVDLLGSLPGRRTRVEGHHWRGEFGGIRPARLTPTISDARI